MQTLAHPRTETIPSFTMCSYPPLNAGTEREPALSFAPGVEFELRFRPYALRIFRAALIVTQSPERANRLANEIWQKACKSYWPMPAMEFTRWLSRLLQHCFAEYHAHAEQHRLTY